LLLVLLRFRAKHVRSVSSYYIEVSVLNLETTNTGMDHFE